MQREGAYDCSGFTESRQLHANPAASKTKTPKHKLRGLLVAPTGVDPVTFRFSVERSTN